MRIASLVGVVFVAVSYGATHAASPLLEVPCGTAATCVWKTVYGVKIPVPPSEHPRLYLRASDKGNVESRLGEPALQPAAERLKALADKSLQFHVEWDAIHYLAAPDRDFGRSIIERTLELLKKTELGTDHNAYRATGRMMVTGAIVYDWLHALLTAEEKKAFLMQFLRLAKTQKSGYPPTKGGSITGLASEAIIMRDMLSAGIALYDEFPEMYDLAASRFFREHLPARNWFYRARAHYQGDYCGPQRFSWETFPLFIFDRLGAGHVYNPEQRWVPYYFLYSTRPDGQRLRNGDSYMQQTIPRGQPWGEFIGTLFAASYYGDGVLLDQALRQGGIGDDEALFEFLWRDPRLQSVARDGLSLSYYAPSPLGWMIARTGWGDDAVLAEMKVNEYNTVNHQHADAGAFQIYYKGPLAIDSGIFLGKGPASYGSPHNGNYSWRTIAHNSLLIYDPGENFGRKGCGNDGGQRLPNGRREAPTLDVLLKKEYRTGKVLAHGFGPDPKNPDFTLLQGDITPAYGPKVTQVLRSSVFLNLRDAKVPAALVVFDRVVSAQPSFRKYWLLHSMEKPRLQKTSAIVDRTEYGERGRLVLDVLLPLPSNLKMEAIGGPGKEFWVFGTNYPSELDPDLYPRPSLEAGSWRIEVSPAAPAAEDLFLNVMQVTDRQTAGHLPVRLLESAEMVGCLIEGKDTSWAVIFPRDGKTVAKTVRTEIPCSTPCRALFCNLQPGPWTAQQVDQEWLHTVLVADEVGAAWLKGIGGAWTLEKNLDPVKRRKTD